MLWDPVKLGKAFSPNKQIPEMFGKVEILPSDIANKRKVRIGLKPLKITKPTPTNKKYPFTYGKLINHSLYIYNLSTSPNSLMAASKPEDRFSVISIGIEKQSNPLPTKEGMSVEVTGFISHHLAIFGSSEALGYNFLHEDNYYPAFRITPFYATLSLTTPSSEK